jgi:hypothetical protein
MPNGTTAWSLDDRGKGGVWLWPAGKPAKRVARVSAGKGQEQSWDVRVIDDRHVFVGAYEHLAAYGPPRPGSCPAPNGSRTVELAGTRLYVVGGGRVGVDETYSWSWLVPCERSTGRFLHARLYEGGTYRYNNQADVTPKAAYKTAGVVIAHEVARTNSDGFLTLIPTTTIFTSKPRRMFTSGTPAGPGIDTAPPGPEVPSAGAPPIAAPTTRLLPGAAAWVVDRASPGGVVNSSEVWLADTAGVRRLATVPNTAQAVPAGPALGLALSPDRVSWEGPLGRSGADVRPVANDTVRRVTLLR